MNKRIDNYIANAADFAKPILKHIREVVHEACPQVEETVKWGFPHFEYKGILCSMAAFKNHCAFGFWKAALMKDSERMKDRNLYAMGHMGKITSIKDLPPEKILKALVKEAMKLNDDGVKLPEKKKIISREEIIVPDALKKALVKHRKADAGFSALSPSHKKEYIEWINEAKTEETQNKRVLTTIEWVIEGKSRNWKYMKK